MKNTLLILFSLILNSCSSSPKNDYIQESNYEIIKFNENSVPIISGAIKWDEFLEKSKWNKFSTENKSADVLISKSLCNIINNGDYFLKIITNTHSTLAESQTPVIFRIIEIGKLKPSKYQLYSANKENIIYAHQELYFNSIPTLIILHKNKEIGRITSLPKVSWEQDILSILYKN